MWPSPHALPPRPHPRGDGSHHDQSRNFLSIERAAETIGAPIIKRLAASIVAGRVMDTFCRTWRFYPRPRPVGTTGRRIRQNRRKPASRAGRPQDRSRADTDKQFSQGTRSLFELAVHGASARSGRFERRPEAVDKAGYAQPWTEPAGGMSKRGWSVVICILRRKCRY